MTNLAKLLRDPSDKVAGDALRVDAEEALAAGDIARAESLSRALARHGFSPIAIPETPELLALREAADARPAEEPPMTEPAAGTTPREQARADREARAAATQAAGELALRALRAEQLVADLVAQVLVEPAPQRVYLALDIADSIAELGPEHDARRMEALEIAAQHAQGEQEQELPMAASGLRAAALARADALLLEATGGEQVERAAKRLLALGLDDHASMLFEAHEAKEEP